MPTNSIQALLFDFGGVLAEEGFRLGLMAIAVKNSLDPETFFQTATELIYECGYVAGRSSEAEYWRLVRARTGIAGSDATLTAEILNRFTPRPRMFETVCVLRKQGLTTCILSDQTDWLERLDRRDHFFRHFDAVYNSYRLGKTKRDASLFTEIVKQLGLSPEQALFIDDNPGNTERAAVQGLRVHLFQSQENFLEDMRRQGLLAQA